MHYNVAQLLKEPTGAQREYSVAEAFAANGSANGSETGAGAAPGEYASGAVRLVRTHQGIWARASLRLRLAQDCSRCLDGFATTLALEVEEEYFPEVDVRTGRRIAPPDDWEGLYIGADHILNLGEAAYQSALAALPMKPLCQPDCAGICHSCGADRNRNRCDCDAAPVDPRWSALRALIAEG